jgi:hypothetical protein
LSIRWQSAILVQVLDYGQISIIKRAATALDQPSWMEMDMDMEQAQESQDSQESQQSHELTSQVTYNPDNLLDSLIERLNLKNDAALSRALEVAPPVISKIRHRRLPVGASMLIRMHEVSNMDIRELRELMGDRRTKYRLSDAQGKPKPEKA